MENSLETEKYIVIKSNCIKYVSEFSSNKFEDLQITRLAGMCNEVFKVASPTFSVVYRIHKDRGTFGIFHKYEDLVRGIIDRNKVGPKIYYNDDKILIEQFYIGRSVNDEESSNEDLTIRMMIPLAEYCNMDCGEDIEKMNKKLNLSEMFNNGLLSLVRSHLENFKGKIVKEAYDSAIDLVNILEKEEKLKELFQKYDSDQENFIFGHCDFYHLNIIRGDDDKFYLIDFEDSCRCPLGYDIANLFLVRTIFFNEPEFRYDLRLD